MEVGRVGLPSISAGYSSLPGARAEGDRRRQITSSCAKKCCQARYSPSAPPRAFHVVRAVAQPFLDIGPHIGPDHLGRVAHARMPVRKATARSTSKASSEPGQSGSASSAAPNRLAKRPVFSAKTSRIWRSVGAKPKSGVSATLSDERSDRLRPGEILRPCARSCHGWWSQAGRPRRRRPSPTEAGKDRARCAPSGRAR